MTSIIANHWAPLIVNYCLILDHEIHRLTLDDPDANTQIIPFPTKRELIIWAPVTVRHRLRLLGRRTSFGEMAETILV